MIVALHQVDFLSSPVRLDPFAQRVIHCRHALLLDEDFPRVWDLPSELFPRAV